MKKSTSVLIYCALGLSRLKAFLMGLWGRESMNYTVWVAHYLCLWKASVSVFCCFKLLSEPHLRNWGKSWTLNLALTTMTPFFAFIFLACCVCESHNSAEWSRNRGKKKDTEHVCGCVCMCTYHRCVRLKHVEGCVCERAHTFQLHVCVFGFKVAVPCQPTSSAPLCFSQQSQCACGRGWGNMWGRVLRSKGETQPTCCLQLTGVSWCRAGTQNTIPSIFALARFVCFVKGCTVGMGCDIFNLQ